MIKNYLYTTNHFLLQFSVQLICYKYLNVFYKTLVFILLVVIDYRNYRSMYDFQKNKTLKEINYLK